MIKCKKFLIILIGSVGLACHTSPLTCALQEKKKSNPYARAAQRKKEQLAKKQVSQTKAVPSPARPKNQPNTTVTITKENRHPQLPQPTPGLPKINQDLPPLAKVKEPEYNLASQEAKLEPLAPQQKEKQIKHEKAELQRLERPISSLYPKTATHNPADSIEVNLQETDLLNFLEWMESIYGVKFISGDDLDPAGNNPKAAGKKITYKTHKPLTKKQVWDLFLELIYLFGLTPIATSYDEDHPVRFTLVSTDAAKQAALPAFVGVDWKKIPDIDSVVRFVYFVENSQVETIFNVIKELVSPKASVLHYAPLNALIFTDVASNIKAIMEIVAELDSVTMPEALSVLKLKHANAIEVVTLYNELVAAEVKDKQGPAARFFLQQRSAPTAVYFPENTRLIAEPRTNALITLGNREGIEKVENFIINYVDTELKQPYSPLYVYELQYANADNIAKILNHVTNFGREGTNISHLKDAAQYGGVRDGDKFFRNMLFIAEPSGNRVLIKAEKEDYLKVRDIIRKLDVKQPQVAIEVLIVNVLATKVKELGAQIRNKRTDTLGKNVDFQTSGIRNPDPNNEGIIVDPANGSIMANLVQLASGQNVGSTLVSIGSQAVGGVWALFKALETYVYTNVVSHPFLTTTNKYTAKVSLGETRRVQTGVVQGSGSKTETQDDVSANLSVSITPQINSDGIITLNIEININNFTDSDVPSSARRDTKVIKTIANVANGEILAIGGLLKTRSDETTARVPLLGDVPILGWFFKDKRDTRDKDNLLVFISPQIVEPEYGGGMSAYTRNKVKFSKETLCETRMPAENRDPIHRWFFNNPEEAAIGQIDEYLEKADYCQKDITNWWDATPGCPPKYPGQPLIENERQIVHDPSIMASNEGQPKRRRTKRRSMMEFLPSDEQEVIA